MISQAQMVRANQVIPLPSRETTWPIQTTVNPNMPVGRAFEAVVKGSPYLASYAGIECQQLGAVDNGRWTMDKTFHHRTECREQVVKLDKYLLRL